jgi:hypothetical protein
LRINGTALTDQIIPYLPNTIKSLIIINGGSTYKIFDQLKEFAHLSYLKINFGFHDFFTPLCIDTVHIIVFKSINIIVPNVKNIIIEQRKNYIPKKVQISSLNANVCQLMNTLVSPFEFTLDFPNNTQIIIKNDDSKYNSDIYNDHLERLTLCPFGMQ